MKKLFARFAKDESGVTAIEYGLIATLIGVAIIAGATTLGTQLNTAFTTISGKIRRARTCSSGTSGRRRRRSRCR